MEPQPGAGEQARAGATDVVVLVEPEQCSDRVRRAALEAALRDHAASRRIHRIAAVATPSSFAAAALVPLLGCRPPADVEECAAAVVAAVGDGVLTVERAHLLDPHARRVLAAVSDRCPVVLTTTPEIAAGGDVALLGPPERFRHHVRWLDDAGADHGGDEPVVLAHLARRRLARAADHLGPTARRWIAGASAVTVVVGGALPVDAPRGLLDAPPRELLDRRVAVVDDDRIVVRWGAFVSACAATGHDAGHDAGHALRAAAARCTDVALASDLLHAAGDVAGAAARAAEALEDELAPDVRARLTARAASARGDLAAAAEALLDRELVGDLAELAASHSLGLAHRLALARVLDDEVERLRLSIEAVDHRDGSDVGDELARAALVLEGTLDSEPVEPVEPGDHGEQRDHDGDHGDHGLRDASACEAERPDWTRVDAARRRWGLALVRAAAAGEAPVVAGIVDDAERCAPVTPAWGATVAATRALIRLHATGDVREPEVALGRRVDGLVDAPRPTLPSVVVDAHRCVGLADAGRSGDALDLLERRLRGEAPLTVALRRWALAEVELAAGHPVRALRAASGHLDLHPGVADRSDGEVPATRAAVLALATAAGAWGALEAGEPDPPAVAIGWPALRALDHERAAITAWSRHRDAAGSDGGAPGPVAEELLRAAALWDQVSVRAALRCRWAAGELHRVAGDLGGARAILEPAEAAASALGQLPILSRIRQSLRRAGVRAVGARGTGSGRLSAREAEVIRLVGKGLTTRAIAQQLGIGAATVETQVASAVAKLGARSRLHAALLLQEAT